MRGSRWTTPASATRPLSGVSRPPVGKLRAARRALSPSRACNEHVLAVAAVLIGVCVAGIGALHFHRRPEAGGLLAFDLNRGTLRFAERAQTASVHLRAIGRGVVVVSGADTCSSVVHGEQLYAYSLPGGALRWRRRFHGACDDFDPVDPVSGGIVAVYATRGFEGWSVADGSTRWRTGPFPATPRQTDGAVVGVDSNTGAVRFLAKLTR